MRGKINRQIVGREKYPSLVFENTPIQIVLRVIDRIA